jgi:hypothetical protein
MGIKVQVEATEKGYFISDGGRIAGALGATPQGVLPLVLGFMVGHVNHVGPMVDAMEGILTRFHAQQINLMTKNNPTSAAKDHLDATGGPVPAKAGRNGRSIRAEHDASRTEYAERKAKMKTLSLDDLGLKNQQLWRLKAAKINTIAKLGALTEDKLLAKDGVGPAIVKAVKKGLKKHGLRLTSPVG